MGSSSDSDSEEDDGGSCNCRLGLLLGICGLREPFCSGTSSSSSELLVGMGGVDLVFPSTSTMGLDSALGRDVSGGRRSAGVAGVWN